MAAIEELVDSTALSRSDCLRLLAVATIGRVVCTDGALPTAEPVRYLLDRDEVIFRTSVHSRLATASRNAVVAFQCDDLDAQTGTGWSVLGVGKAYEVTGENRLSQLETQQRLAGRPGHPTHVIAIPLWRLTGHRLLVSGLDDGAEAGSSPPLTAPAASQQGLRSVR